VPHGYLGAVLLVPALALAACGPSFQAVYECDVRFEHCYALDQGAAAVDAKKECWRDWLHTYTWGQSRDRVEYAATRFSELSLDRTLPSEEVRGAGPPRRQRAVAAPVPTSAFAPPPNIAEGRAAGPDPPVATPPPPRPPTHEVAAHAPGADCADGCARSWKGCHETCTGTAACEACDRAYRACMPACFR